MKLGWGERSFLLEILYGTGKCDNQTKGSLWINK